MRIDTAIYNGYKIPSNYDSMILKLIVHDKDRFRAINKMQCALGELVIEGVDTNIDFQFDILGNNRFISGDINTHFIQDEYNL